MRMHFELEVNCGFWVLFLLIHGGSDVGSPSPDNPDEPSRDATTCNLQRARNVEISLP